MENQKNIFLIFGAMLSAVAALLHLACIYFGAPLFRFLGTEAMPKMYESGNTTHPIIACVILATILFSWSAYALSGAGVIRKLPLLRFALIGITSVYLIRGLAFPFLTSYFPENSMLFWYLSSAVVFAFGLIHFMGVKQAWARL